VTSEPRNNVSPPRIAAPQKNNTIPWTTQALEPLPRMANNLDTATSPPIVHHSNPNSHQHPERTHTFGVVEQRIDSGFKSIKSFARRKTKSSPTSLQEWALPSRPYLEYVRQLIAAGWSNLQDLDDYLLNETAQAELVVSVLDITQDGAPKRWPDIHNELDLKRFMESPNRGGVSVRLYMAEYQSCPASGLIETLGGGLKLDPRFFQWSIHSKGHVFTPSMRHRAPYVSLGFGLLDASTSRTTDAEKFKVLVYIQVRSMSKVRATSNFPRSRMRMGTDGLVSWLRICQNYANPFRRLPLQHTYQDQPIPTTPL